MATTNIKFYNPDGWNDIFLQFQELFVSSFTYKNLPEGISPRFIETILFMQTGVSFIYDDIADKHFVTRFIPHARMDIYGEPEKVTCIGGGGGYYQKIKETQTEDINNLAVLMYNNFTRTTAHDRLKMYAMRIHHIENTIDVNVNAQKTPYIIIGNKKHQNTMKRIYTQMERFEPAIFVDDSVDMSQIRVLSTNAPYVTDQLEEHKRKLWNEALSFIGIDNNASEKNERLLHDEVIMSNGLAIANRNARLQCREMAIEKVNRMFGLNIEVQFNNPSFFDQTTKGGERDADLRGAGAEQDDKTTDI
jgi:hypothetical protein